MKEQDVSQLVKEMAELCQQQMVSIALSPAKQAVVMTVMAAIAMAPGVNGAVPPPGGGFSWWKQG